jgi:hypothetical protein
MRGGIEYIAARIAIEDRGYSSPCWIWQKATNEKGYAKGRVPGFLGMVRVHRAAYELHVGPIPDGLVIDHLCRVPACCNPAHLEPVTIGENTRRGEQGLPRSHCRRGHELSGENVGVSKSGNRFCKECNRTRKRLYMRHWQARNRDAVRKRAAEFRQAHREEINAKKREMRAAGVWSS